MVARVTFGEQIEKAIRYNEAKVANGKGECLEASGIGWGMENLSIRDKVAWFEDLTSRNKMVTTNAIHISLSFHPTEDFTKAELRAIASSYMGKVGFGCQPYLLYLHKDTKHPHVHIVSTNIQYDSTRIDTKWFFKDKSEPARIEIEEEFGLIKASGRDVGRVLPIGPLNVEVLQYGDHETKAAITSVVREVVNNYRFSSIEELNQVLLQFNVTVDTGKEGSRIEKTGGILYSMVDSNGFKVGKQIKASLIYTKPTLQSLEEKYHKKHEQKLRYRGRLIRVIDDALQVGGSKDFFIFQLDAAGVKVIFHTNESDFTYGITFIDNLTKCVFKGSDLKKGYSGSAILKKITEAADPSFQYNFLFTIKILSRTNYRNTPSSILRWWKKAGLKMLRYVDSNQRIAYFFGHSKTSPHSFVRVPKELAVWLEDVRNVQKDLRYNSKFRAMLCDENFLEPAEKYFSKGFSNIFQAHTDLLTPVYIDNSLPHQLLREARKKKRKRR